MERSNSTNLASQKEALTKELGLDVAAKLGVATGDIFTKEDLQVPNSSATKLSAREKNKLKRTLSKQKSKQAWQKKMKLAPKLFTVITFNYIWVIYTF